MKNRQREIEALRMEIGRMCRLYGRDELPEKISNYILTNFCPIGESDPIIRGNVKAAPKDREKVTAIVVHYFEVSRGLIFTKTRKKEVTYARHMLVYLLYMRASMSMESVGEFVDRDHTSISHAVKRIKDGIVKDPIVRTDVTYLLKQLDNINQI